MSFFYDARSALVYLCVGPLIVDVMSIGEYRVEFDTPAVRALIHGDAMREVR
jgi:hypothetical protein